MAPMLTSLLAFLGLAHGVIKASPPVVVGSPRRAASVRMDEGGSGPFPEEWREFRRQLISGGIKLTTDSLEPSDGGSAAASSDERRVVAPGNEALLRSQNAQLYEEYIRGSWAHESPVEAGGLLLRMPLEAQLTHFLRDNAGADALIGDELRQRLRKELSALEDGGGGDKRCGSPTFLPPAISPLPKFNPGPCTRASQVSSGTRLPPLLPLLPRTPPIFLPLPLPPL
jgi:hypothetical protein